MIRAFVKGGVVAAMLLPVAASAGPFDKLKKPEVKKPDTSAVKCENDHGVEDLGTEMDEKAYDALIAANDALASLQEAAGKKDLAEKTRAQSKKWTKDDAPKGTARVKEIGRINETIRKGAEWLAKQESVDDAAKAKVKESRWNLRKAMLYVAWGGDIAQPIPGKAKEAIAADKACSSKVKGPVDAATGLGVILGKMKQTYATVDDAAKKAGVGEMTAEEKKQQDSDAGAPEGLGV